MQPHRRYLLIALGSALIFASLAAGLNWLVDPLAQFGNNRTGLYAFDASAERRFDARALARGNYDGVLLGDSIVARLNPTLFPGHRVFNAGVVGASVEDMSAMADIIPRARFVLLELDISMLRGGETPMQHPASPLEPPSARTWIQLFTLDALRATLTTLWSRALNIKPLFGANGHLDDSERVQKEKAMPTYAWDGPLLAVQSVWFTPFVYSTERVAELRRMKERLEGRGIRVFAYLAPVSTGLQGLIRKLGLWGDFERMRTDMTTVFPGLVDLSVGRYSDPAYFFKVDPIHHHEGVIEPELAAYIDRGLAARP